MVWTPRHNEGSAGRHFALAGWLFPAALISAAALLEAGGDPVRLALRYDRAAIADAEVWRLVTGHIVHLGPSHLAMNVAGLALVWALCGSRLRPLQWLAVTAVIVAVIDAGFWFLMPGLSWYVGLSGVLHGLLVVGAAAGLSSHRVESATILVMVTLKVAWEQYAGALPGSAATAGGSVVVEAHLYGATGGVLAALPVMVGVWRQRSL